MVETESQELRVFCKVRVHLPVPENLASVITFSSHVEYPPLVRYRIVPDLAVVSGGNGSPQLGDTSLFNS